MRTRPDVGVGQAKWLIFVVLGPFERQPFKLILIYVMLIVVYATCISISLVKGWSVDQK